MLLFTKPALAGRVKTRLVGAELVAGDAAALHQAFFLDLVERFESAPFELRACWALEPGESVPAWPAGGRAQAGGDLGDRLLAAFRACAGRSRFVAAIGADHPELAAEDVEAAFDALRRGADLALGPAEDGGYYLIALRPEAAHPRLFEAIEWSGPTVCATTLSRARELDYSIHELPLHADVDTRADLAALAARLAEVPERCPRTYGELVRLGWIPEQRCAS